MSGPEGTDEAVLLPLSPGAGDDGGEAKDRQPPISLSYYASLGVTGTGEGCVEHVADGSVAFLVGRHVALYNYETQRHRFLLKPAKTTEIVTFSVSKNRKYIALAERVADKGTTASEVSIWHIDPKAQDSSPVQMADASSLPPAKRIRTIPFAYLSKNAVVSVNFSADNRVLASLTTTPDPYLYVWQIEKSPCRLVAMLELPFKPACVTVSPFSSSSLFVGSTSSVRFFKHIPPHQLKPIDPMAKRREYRYTCHAWFDHDSVVAGTADGDILVFDQTELRKTLPAVHGENSAIWCIAVLSRGFLCAGESGFVTLFERTYEGAFFQVYRTVQTPDRNLRVSGMSVSPNEETVVACSDGNKLLAFSLSGMDLMTWPAAAAAAAPPASAAREVSFDDTRDRDRLRRSSRAGSGAGGNSNNGGGGGGGGGNAVTAETFFKPLAVTFHSDLITAFATCTQRSCFYTASVDKTVRIYNYARRKLELEAVFDEEISALACDSAGLRLVLAFKYKLTLYCVLAKALQPVQDFPVKHCKEVSFSAGGHLFAAVVVTKIFLYNSHTFTCIGFLSGHSSMVKSVQWCYGDQVLVSGGYEGAVYFWRVDTCRRIEKCEVLTKAIAHSVARYNEDTKNLVLVGTLKIADNDTPDGTTLLRSFKVAPNPTTLSPPAHPAHPPPAGGSASDSLSQSMHQPIVLGVSSQQLLHSKSHVAPCAISPLHKVVFAGTPSGQIAVYPFPIVGPAPCLVLDAHTKPVIFVVLSVDERLLITVSEDLSLFVFEIASPSAGAADVGAGKVSKNGKQFLVPALNEVMCTLQVDLDQQLKAIDQLTRLNEELRSTRTHRMHTLKEECKEQVSRKRAATQKAVEECYQQKHAADTEAQQTVENAAKSRTEAEALHKEAAVRLDRLFEAQVEAMAECCSRLQHERDDAVAGYENEIHRLNKEWTKDRDRRIASLEQVEAQASAQLQAIADEKNDLSADGEARIGQLEREYESDLTQVKKDYAGKQAKRDAQYEADMLNYTAGVRVQEKNALEVEKLLRDVKARDEVLQKATARNKDLEKANDALRLEIDVRIDTTVSSERKTHDLKHHTAELEKLRYVLSFKFSELRREVAPKEKQIAFIEKKIDEMQFELEKVATDIAHLQRDVRRMETKAGGLRREIDRCAEELEQKESIQKGLHRKLIGVLEAATQRTILRGVRDLVEEFALYQGSPSSSVPSAAADYHRKRTYVEKQLSSTKKQSSRRKANLEHASQRKTVENSILVREINELRHEKKSLMEKLDHTDAAVRELRAKLAALGFSASQQRSSPMAARPNSAFAPATPMTSASQAQLPTSPTPPVPPGLRLKAGKRDFLASNAGTLAQLARLDAVNITEVIQQVEANNLHMEKQQAEILKLRDFVAHLLARSKLEDAPSDEQAKVYDDIKAAFVGSQ